MAAAVSGAVCDVGERVARTQSRDVGREGVQAEGNVLAHSWTHVDALTRGIVHLVFIDNHRMSWVGRDLKNHPVPWAGTASSRPGCSKPHPTGLKHFQGWGTSSCSVMHGESSFGVQRVLKEMGELYMRICFVQLGGGT